MYYLKIGHQSYSFYDFNESLSFLKKKDRIEFHFSIYIHDYSNYKSDLDSLDSFYRDITVSKSVYYHWIFMNCQILEKSLKVDKEFCDYLGRQIQKFDVRVSISYEEVFSSNNKTLLDREIKIKKLLE